MDVFDPGSPDGSHGHYDLRRASDGHSHCNPWWRFSDRILRPTDLQHRVSDDVSGVPAEDSIFYRDPYQHDHKAKHDRLRWQHRVRHNR